MRRVTFKSVLDKVCVLATGQLSGDVDTADVNRLRVFLNMRAGQYWEHFFWPEITLVEERQFRADWSSATTYGAPTATSAVERFYAPAGKYYQSLRATNLNNAPATGDADEENSAWWAECAAEYEADEYTTGTVFAVGDQTLNPADDRYYQCHTAHTAGATLDATKFGILTPFIRSIDYEQSGETVIGEIKKVWSRNPQAIERAGRCEIRFDLLGGTIVVRGLQARVWLEFRERVPSWTGDLYAAATTYAADAQVYDATEGDFFKSLAGSNTGRAVTETAWWERIEFPYFLRDAAAQGAYADWLRSEGESDKFLAEEALALRTLQAEIKKIELKQGQSAPLNVASN